MFCIDMIGFCVLVVENKRTLSASVSNSTFLYPNPVSSVLVFQHEL